MSKWEERLHQHLADADMVSSTELISDIRARGMRIYLSDKGICIDPASKLDQTERDLIKLMRATIITLLLIESAKTTR